MPSGRMRADASCEHCGGPFQPTRPWSRFCSPECRKAAYRERRRQEAVERLEARVRAAMGRIEERVRAVVREELEAALDDSGGE